VSICQPRRRRGGGARQRRLPYPSFAIAVPIALGAIPLAVALAMLLGFGSIRWRLSS
jgi:hypothetical protein